MTTFNHKITSEIIEKLKKEEIPNVNIDFEGVLGTKPKVILEGITDEKLEEMFKEIHQTIIKSAGVPAYFLDPMGIIEPVKGKPMSEEEYKKFKILAEQLKKLGAADIDVPITKQESRPLQGIGTSDILPRFPLVSFDISEAKNARPNVNKPDDRGNVIPSVQEILTSKARQCTPQLSEEEEGIVTMEYRRRRDDFMKKVIESSDDEKQIKPEGFDQMLQHFLNRRNEYKEKMKLGMDMDGDTDTLKTLANTEYGDRLDYDKMQFESMATRNITYGTMGDDRKIEAHSTYGTIGNRARAINALSRPYTMRAKNMDSYLPGGEHIQYPVTTTMRFWGCDILAELGEDYLKKIEMARDILINHEGSLKTVKYRGNMMYGINTDGFETVTLEQAKSMSIENFEGKSLIIELPQPEPFVPESKILKLDETKHIGELVHRLRTGYNYSLKESDEICKVFDRIFDKQIIDEFPEALSDLHFLSDIKQCPSILASSVRWAYIHRAGFAIVTNKFADALAKYLKGKKCLEIMAGKAVISKSLQDRGIDIIPTDNLSWHDDRIYGDSWTDVEDIEAGDAIRKYNDVDVIIVSWMPLDVKGKRIARMIRKHNPDVEIISIQEDCTANDSWYDRVEYNQYDEFEEVHESFLSWWGVHDKPYSCRISKPWTHRNTQLSMEEVAGIFEAWDELSIGAQHELAKAFANIEDKKILKFIEDNMEGRNGR